MFASEAPPPLSAIDTEAFSVMRPRSTSIATSHLSLKPSDPAEPSLHMMDAVLTIPSDPIQVDIPIREISDDDPQANTQRHLSFDDLPVEVHECVLDWLFGVRNSTSSNSTPGQSSAVRGWSSVLRHPRRKALSDLALVSSNWRPLVQERLFRHSKPPSPHPLVMNIDFMLASASQNQGHP